MVPTKQQGPKRLRFARPRLATLLQWWGVRRWKERPGLHELAMDELWDLYEAARQKYVEGIKRHHPDRGGQAADAATLNDAWERTRVLFGRMGISTE